MRYWDTSAIAPLAVEEPGSQVARQWLAEDPQMVTWSWTRVELTSAVERRVREGRLTRTQRRQLLQRFAELTTAWDEVTDVLAVRSLALPLLARHPLRAADAAQLGAALLTAESDPASLTFVCLDCALAGAAEREGLDVLSWPAE
ncbi:type II toxin-antitoxin system VapC family toxin [Planctomycetota bacterium]